MGRRGARAASPYTSWMANRGTAGRTWGRWRTRERVWPNFLCLTGPGETAFTPLSSRCGTDSAGSCPSGPQCGSKFLCHWDPGAGKARVQAGEGTNLPRTPLGRQTSPIRKETCPPPKEPRAAAPLPSPSPPRRGSRWQAGIDSSCAESFEGYHPMALADTTRGASACSRQTASMRERESMRLDRMRALTLEVHRWATVSPARWTRPSTPSRAFGSRWPTSGSQWNPRTECRPARSPRRRCGRGCESWRAGTLRGGAERRNARSNPRPRSREPCSGSAKKGAVCLVTTEEPLPADKGSMLQAPKWA